MQPNWPIASSSSFRPSWSRMSEAFQKPSTACSLKAAMPHSISPSYMKVGMLHLSVSSVLGQAAWTTWRMWRRIGWANGFAFSM